MIHEQDVIGKKIRFAKETILPFFLKKYNRELVSKQDKDSVVSKVVRMNIFPYITETGVKYGKLEDSEISWYYCDGQAVGKIKSTDSYRIFACEEYPSDLFWQLRLVFGTEGSGHLQKYSEEVVIKDLIHKMEKEKSYSDAWWSYACDAFEKWYPQMNPGSGYQNATKGIQEAYFLYDDEKILPVFQELMNRLNVYKDIRKTAGFHSYIERKIGGGKNEQDKIRFLKYLGVPSSFIERGIFGTSCLTAPVQALLESIDRLIYPVSKSDGNQYDRCRLAEYILLHVLYEEDRYFVSKLIKDKVFSRKIPILNIKQQFVRASQCLFYFGSYEQSYVPENSLNYLLVDRTYKLDLKQQIANMIESVKRYDDYSLSNVTAMLFYKWVWQYTHSDDLIQNILICFDKLKKIGISDAAFAFDVVDSFCIKESDAEGNETIVLKNLNNYTPIEFTVHTTAEKIIQYRSLLNVLYKNEKYKIFVTLSDRDLEKEDSWTNVVKERILIAAINSNRVYYSRIENDSMWENIYSVYPPDAENDFFGQYIAVRHIDSRRGMQDNMIIVAKNNNINSYIIALCTYIKDHLGITLTNVTTDWNKQYNALSAGVRDFLMEKRPLILDEQLSFMTSEMADLKTLDAEITTWNKLREQKESIRRNRVTDSDFDQWRQFLDSKYHGRCQLCGNKTVSGKDTSHTWTYRIVKQRDNNLANMECNLFCLCPSCHGEMSYGFRGRDLTMVLETAKEYAAQLMECLEENPDDTDASPSIISDYADYENDYEGFHAPLTCDVIVNGEEQKMKFSWEHFLHIAFLLTDVK